MRRTRSLLALAAFLFPFLVFLAGPYHGSGDTEPAELLPISIVENGRLDFDRFYGSRPDLPYAFRGVGGHVVSAYPIVAGLAGVPVHAAARMLGLDLYSRRIVLAHVTASLLSAASSMFLFLALLSICRSPKRALFFALLYAFATEVWAVASHGLWQHAPSLLFLAASVWLLLSRSRARVAIAGCTLALAVVSRPTDLLLAIPAAVFVLRRRGKAFPGFALGAAVPAAAIAMYSAKMLGSAFAFGQLYRAPFSGKILPGLAGILWSPSRGLFVFSPVLLAALPGAVAAIRSRRDEAALLRLLAAGVVALVVLISAWGMWWGGGSFGYRIVLDAAPVLVLLAAFGAESALARSPSLRAGFFVLLALSVFVEVLGVFAYPTSFDEGLDLEPSRLWDVRGSELVLGTRKLFGGKAASADRSEVAPPLVWWTPALDDDTIPGWLDQSPGGREILGALEVSGWAKSATGEVEVAIRLDGRPAVFPDRFPRPDVARVVPELGDTSLAGFRATFAAGRGFLRQHVLVVELRDARGRVRRLGPVHFLWSGS